MSSVSDSDISVFDGSTTEFSTSGLSLKTDRSKSPFADFKDERISWSELVSVWLDQVEIRRCELLDPEEEQHIGRILNEAAEQLDAEYKQQRLVQTLSPLLLTVGLSVIMSVLKL